MVPADLAERAFSLVAYQLAEVGAVEQGAALVFPEYEVRRFFAADAFPHPFAKGAGHSLVTGKALGVDVDLPACTTGMTAARCNAVKSGIVVRYINIHGVTSVMPVDRLSESTHRARMAFFIPGAIIIHHAAGNATGLRKINKFSSPKERGLYPRSGSVIMKR